MGLVTERDLGRREKIARWVFRKVVIGRVRCLPFSLDPMGVVDMLVREDPSLEMDLVETPLSRIRKEVEDERKKMVARGVQTRR